MGNSHSASAGFDWFACCIGLSRNEKEIITRESPSDDDSIECSSISQESVSGAESNFPKSDESMLIDRRKLEMAHLDKLFLAGGVSTDEYAPKCVEIDHLLDEAVSAKKLKASQSQVSIMSTAEARSLKFD